MNIEIVGKFFDNHSLSIVNRNIVLNMYTMLGDDFRLCITPLDSYNPESGLNKKEVKILKELAAITLEDVDVQLRHSYPPIWQWPVSEKTKVVYIQPWEYEKVPFEWQYKFETFEIRKSKAFIKESRLPHLENGLWVYGESGYLTGSDLKAQYRGWRQQMSMIK